MSGPSKWFKKTSKPPASQPTTSHSNGNITDRKPPTPASAAEEKEPWRSLEDLEEALENIANEPPIVARSIPKGLHLERIGDNSKIAAIQRERSMRHCLYAPEVYDHMLADTMNVCSLLQDNLDDYITQVRGNTPPDRQSTPVNGEVVVTDTAVSAKPKKTAWFASGTKNKQPPMVTTS